VTVTVRDEDALLTLAFSLRANPGAYALLLGAGVSAPSGIPTAWGVLEDLTSRVAQLAGADPEDPVQWYEAHYGEPAQYETLLEKLAPTPVERQRLLRDYFEPSVEDVEAERKKPTVAHRAIARLVRAGSVKLIVTLNFDRLIEQAIRAEGIEPTVVASPSDVEGLAPLHTLDCCVVHLHGDYLNPTSMLNTTTELEAYNPSTLKLLHRILEDYGLMIAGWSSVYDPALRDAIAAHYPSRFTLAWIEPGASSDQAVELRTLKKGLLVPTDADAGFGRLADSVEALLARDARHPLTISVAVETAKRELSGRQVAIGLHDTVTREFSRLHDHQDFHLASHQSDEPYGGYDAILERIEEASKVSCALVATLAYWGDETSDGWWIDELERFSSNARGGGLTKLLSLRVVTGSALFYSAGVAAVAARRYDLLAQLFGASRTNPYRDDREPLALVLAADSAYAEATGHGTRLYSLVRPVLLEALAIGIEPLDEAWQLFEVLRMTTAVMAHPRFGEELNSFEQLEAALIEEQSAFEEAERAGGDVDEVRQSRAAAWQNRDRELGSIASLVDAGRPHVLTADLRMDEGYRSIVAERLASDLETEADSHLLVRAQLVRDPRALVVALRAVSVALGRIGSQLAWSRVQSSFGSVPNEVWLDTGKTPEELASQQA
jgi:SIR2-like domain